MTGNFERRFRVGYMSWIAAAAMSALSIGMISMALFGQTVFARADDPNAIVAIDKFMFAPAALTVTPGATVTFENRDDMVHSIVGVGGSFRSKALDTGDKFSFTFDKPGEYAYFCGLHPYMKGKVVVAP
jgi:plastocyanin